jgi:hypothetical protein
MTKSVTVDGTVQPCRHSRLRDDSLERALQNVVPADTTGTRTARQPPGGEDELPLERLGCPWVLPLQCIGQFHARNAPGHVALVQGPPRGQLLLQFLPNRAGQHDHPILVALAAANQDLVPIQVEIMHAQSAALA